MSYKDDIRKAIRMGSVDEGSASFLCQVFAVDEASLTCSCTPMDGGPDILNVNLMPIGGKVGHVLFPKVSTSDTDGFVIVTMTGPNDGFVSMFGEVDRVYLNGNAFGGLTKIEELVTKLNNLEQLVNDLVALYNTHVHVVALATITPVSGPSLPTASLETTVLVPTQRTELENPLIEHGDGT